MGGGNCNSLTLTPSFLFGFLSFLESSKSDLVNLPFFSSYNYLLNERRTKRVEKIRTLMFQDFLQTTEGLNISSLYRCEQVWEHIRGNNQLIITVQTWRFSNLKSLTTNEMWYVITPWSETIPKKRKSPINQTDGVKV